MIVTTAYRPKRPRKRKPVAIAGPAIERKPAVEAADDHGPATKPLGAAEGFIQQPANDDRKPAIVTTRRRGKRNADVPDMTPEEYQRRGDAADALWLELVRAATSKDLP